MKCKKKKRKEKKSKQKPTRKTVPKNRWKLELLEGSQNRWKITYMAGPNRNYIYGRSESFVLTRLPKTISHFMRDDLPSRQKLSPRAYWVGLFRAFLHSRSLHFLFFFRFSLSLHCFFFISSRLS